MSSLTDLFPRDTPITHGALGVAGKKIDPRTLRLSNYMKRAVSPPSEAHHSHVVADWGMLLNDNLGDCVPAAGLHSDELFNAVAKNPVPQYKDKDAEHVYEVVGGYVPGDPSTDNGCYLIDMLNYWRHYGLPTTKNKLGAFTSVDPKNATQIKTAVWEFGVSFIALELPISAQTQLHWDVPKGGTRGDGAPGSWGGHCVPIASYDKNYLALITWGGVQLATWSFIGTYCDEAYALLSADQLNNGKSNLGLDIRQLTADLKTI